MHLSQRNPTVGFRRRRVIALAALCAGAAFSVAASAQTASAMPKCWVTEYSNRDGRAALVNLEAVQQIAIVSRGGAHYGIQAQWPRTFSWLTSASRTAEKVVAADFELLLEVLRECKGASEVARPRG